MAPRHATVIINPEAGTHDADTTARAIQEGLDEAEVVGKVLTTERAEDTAEFAANAVAAGAELVIVAGGDGTVMGAVGALKNTGVPLLPLPLGTWNGLVRMLGAPMSLGDALAQGLAGEMMQIDIGYIPEIDRHFLLWAGAGIDAEVMAVAERSGAKKKWGYWAYLGALADRLGGSKNRRMRLEIDGNAEEYDAHTILSFNVNDLRFAGLQVGPVVDPRDGKMDLTVLTREGLLGTVQEMMRVLTSGPREDDQDRDDTWLTASRLRIDADPPLDVQADGEVVGKTPLTFEVLPNALTVLAPKGYEGGLEKRERKKDEKEKKKQAKNREHKEADRSERRAEEPEEATS